MILFSGNALWELLKQSDLMSCAVVVILAIMSVIGWAIALYKIAALYRSSAQVKDGIERLHDALSVEQLIVVNKSLPLGSVAHKVSAKVLTSSHKLLSEHGGLSKQLSAHDIELIRCEVDALLNTIMIEQERYLPFLRVSAEVAPLLGLFGTIWGLIHSFVRISQEQSADIITVAPGIAEALITTLIGLMVAVPALVFYNCLHGYVQRMEHQLIILADRCIWIVQSSLQHRE